MKDQFVTLMGGVNPAMIIVTTATGTERGGCLVGFHSQSSIEPERYAIWLSKANYTYRIALRATHFGVHFLTSEDIELAELFGAETGDDIDKFERTPYTPAAGGVPVIDACAHWLVVQKVALLDEGGDHVCISTQPVAGHADGGYEPLRLSSVRHLQPGHAHEERNDPPTERARKA
jgi:flavin reductase (DIM6/NTAB) family NADH-FMN oxidoreductase RutF